MAKKGDEFHSVEPLLEKFQCRPRRGDSGEVSRFSMKVDTLSAVWRPGRAHRTLAKGEAPERGTVKKSPGNSSLDNQSSERTGGWRRRERDLFIHLEKFSLKCHTWPTKKAKRRQFS